MDLNCIASLDGMFVDLNQRWKDALGYTLDDLKSKPFLDFIHPEDIDGTLAALADLAGHGKVVDFRNRYRTKDGDYRWLQWSAYPPGDGEEHIYASARLIDGLVEFEYRLEQSNKVLAGITMLQNNYIRYGEGPTWWDTVLMQVLEITGSEYGFIGVTETDEEGPLLRTKAITNIAWNEETEAFYAQNAPQGMVFRNMDTLFGRPIVEEQLLISNDVSSDPRAGGRPSGHPPLNRFAALPIRDENGMHGLMGLANAPRPYKEDELEILQPILVLLSRVLRSIELESRANETARQLEDVRMLQGRVLESSQTGVLVLDENGEQILVNAQARDLLALELSSPTESVTRKLRRYFQPSSQLDELLAFVREPSSVTSRTLELRSTRGDVLDEPDLEVVVRWIGEEDRTFPLLLSVNDLRQRQALASSLRLNSQLEARVQQLARIQRHNETLSECVEFLQTCTSLQEGLQLLSRAVRRFFAEANDARLYAVGEGDSQTMLELTVDSEEEVEERRSEDCWALRSRRVYSSWPGGHTLRCAHVGCTSESHYCVPLFSLDRVVAVISIGFDGSGNLETEELRRARLSEFLAMGQSISGALSTIALRESLQRLALSDELTGLPNRRAFQTEANRMVARHRRRQHPFVVGIVDIDHFKSVNDDLGHAQGDVVLSRVAHCMQAHFREGDLCARLGGEEFGLFMSGCTAEDAQDRLDLLVQNVERTCKIGQRPVTISIGFVESSPGTAQYHFEHVLGCADAALYRAKEGGRNRAVMGLIGQSSD